MWLSEMVLWGLSFCFISAKGWELIVIPRCGMRVPAVGVLAGGGGNLFWQTSTGKMPMVVHWRRCGFVVLRSYWILRLHMRGLRRRLQQDSGGRRRTSGPRRQAYQKRLEAEDFAKESLYFLHFSFVPRGCVQFGDVLLPKFNEIPILSQKKRINLIF